MPVELDTSALEDAFEEMSRDAAREAAGRWFTAAEEALLDAGDELGYAVFPVVQAARPPEWDAGRGGYVFVFPHEASQFFNDGTAPHEIEGDPVLAFEWEEMAGEEFGDTGMTFEEAFEHSWPTVFLPEVEVEGINAIRYFERGERQAIEWLRGQA